MSLVSRGWFVRCDARKCDTQFDAGDGVTDRDAASLAAIEAGWVEATTTIKGTTETLHYCPKVHRIVRTRRPKSPKPVTP